MADRRGIITAKCGKDLVRSLGWVCRKTGEQKTIRAALTVVAPLVREAAGDGPEFISRDMDLWAYHRGVILDFGRPGKPRDNAFIEAFNGKFCQECLNAHWFLNLADAAEKLPVGVCVTFACRATVRYDNEERPHSAIENKSPMMLVKSEGDTSPPI